MSCCNQTNRNTNKCGDLELLGKEGEIILVYDKDQTEVQFTLADVENALKVNTGDNKIPILQIDDKGRVISISEEPIDFDKIDYTKISLSRLKEFYTLSENEKNTFIRWTGTTFVMTSITGVDNEIVVKTAGLDTKISLAPLPALSNEATDFKVPKIATDDRGRVVSIVEVDLKIEGDSDIAVSGTGNTKNLSLKDVFPEKENVIDNIEIPLLKVDKKGRVSSLTTGKLDLSNVSLNVFKNFENATDRDAGKLLRYDGIDVELYSLPQQEDLGTFLDFKKEFVKYYNKIVL